MTHRIGRPVFLPLPAGEGEGVAVQPRRPLTPTLSQGERGPDMNARHALVTGSVFLPLPAGEGGGEGAAIAKHRPSPQPSPRGKGGQT